MNFPATLVEPLAAICTAVAVWLASRGRVLTWPVGLVGVFAYGVWFSASGLWANAVLQVLFAMQSVHGWMRWRAARSAQGAPASGKLGRRDLGLTAALAAPVVLLLCLRPELVADWTGRLDWSLSVGSVVATFWLARRLAESWALWAVLDAGYVILFARTEAWLSLVLYGMLGALAASTWWRWRRLVPEVR